MRMYIYILIFLLVLVGSLTPQVALASTTYFSLGGSNYSASNYGGNTTYFSGDVTGTASNYGGNTTYYNINGRSFTGSNYGGSTTYYGGDLSGTASNYGGSTTYYNLGSKNFTGSNYGGSTTYYSGDIAGTASNYGGNTTYYNIRDSFPSYKPSYPSPSNPTLPSYNTPSYNYPSYRPQVINISPASPQSTQVSPVINQLTEEERRKILEEWRNTPNSKHVERSFQDAASKTPESIKITSVQTLGGGRVLVVWDRHFFHATKYTIHYGSHSQNYDFSTSGGNQNTTEIGGLSVGQTFYFTVQASIPSYLNGKQVWQNSSKGNEISVVIK